ncbi:cutinase family protein [Gordonia iterans]
MGVKSVCAVVAAVCAVGAVGAVVAGEAQAGGCPQTMTFAVSGVGNPAHVPGVSGPRTNVYYRSDLHSVVTDPIGTRLSGERALSSSIRSFRAQCPNSHVRVVGHSYGAWIAGNVRDRDPQARRNATYVLVADPRAKMGVLRLVPSVPGFFDAQGTRGRAKAPTATTCRTSDVVCWAPNPVQDPVGFANSVRGYLEGEHGYAHHEVRQTPGTRVIPGPQKIQPPAAAPAPVVTPAPVPPQQTVGDYIPAPIAPHVPAEIRQIPVPRIELPKLPPIRLP